MSSGTENALLIQYLRAAEPERVFNGRRTAGKPWLLSGKGGKRTIARLTCPKCKAELDEVLYVDESVMEFEGRDSSYQLLKTITSTTKCTRCGSVIEQRQEGKKCKIACPSCGISLDTAIGSLETLVEYDEEEGGYSNGKDISGPTITRCLNCGGDLRNINFGNSTAFPKLKRIK